MLVSRFDIFFKKVKSDFSTQTFELIQSCFTNEHIQLTPQKVNQVAARMAEFDPPTPWVDGKH